MLTLKFGRDITDEAAFINAVLSIDSTAYPPDMQGSFQSVSQRYQKNKDTYILVYDDDQLVGYLCFFPITHQLYQAVLTSSTLFDDNITADSICGYGSQNYLFLISVAILPQYQNTAAIGMIETAFKHFLRDKNKQGQTIKGLAAVTVSPDGVKFLSRLNFQHFRKLGDGLDLYLCSQPAIKELTLADD